MLRDTLPRWSMRLPLLVRAWAVTLIGCGLIIPWSARRASSSCSWRAARAAMATTAAALARFAASTGRTAAADSNRSAATRSAACSAKRTRIVPRPIRDASKGAASCARRTRTAARPTRRAGRTINVTPRARRTRIAPTPAAQPPDLRHVDGRLRRVHLDEGLRGHAASALRHDDGSLRLLSRQQRLRRGRAPLLPRRSPMRSMFGELGLRQRDADLRSAGLHVSSGMHQRLAVQRRDAALRHGPKPLRHVLEEQRLPDRVADLRHRQRPLRRLRRGHRLRARRGRALLRQPRRHRSLRRVHELEAMPDDRAELQQRHLRAVTARFIARRPSRRIGADVAAPRSPRSTRGS